MGFSIYCPYCESTVRAGTILVGKELKRALDSNGEIEVGHVTNAGDHRWNLIREEKEILRNRLVTGDLSVGA